jgi:hypothetical protein
VAGAVAVEAELWWGNYVPMNNGRRKVSATVSTRQGERWPSIVDEGPWHGERLPCDSATSVFWLVRGGVMRVGKLGEKAVYYSDGVIGSGDMQKRSTLAESRRRRAAIVAGTRACVIRSMRKIPVTSQVNVRPVAIADEGRLERRLNIANTLRRLLIHPSHQLMGHAIRLCLLCAL